jgi:hypothetical protein
MAWLPHPRITRTRVGVALAVAVLADVAQVATGPLGWIVLDDAIDILAAAVTMTVLGFHMLLLPTFILEWLPVVGMLPTWTGCVLAVAALRREEWQHPSVEVM